MDYREITFEELEKACTGLQTTNIKGKEYVQVNERVKAFRKVYPTGYIIATMVSNEGGVCVFEAEVGFYIYDEEDPIFAGNQIVDCKYKNPRRVALGTGTAFEVQNASYINKTSYLENCETSAIGRALGFAGFGLDVAIASAEEMVNAVEGQARMKPIGTKGKKDLEKICQLHNWGTDWILQRWNVSRLEDLTTEQFREINEFIEAQPQG